MHTTTATTFTAAPPGSPAAMPARFELALLRRVVAAGADAHPDTVVEALVAAVTHAADDLAAGTATAPTWGPAVPIDAATRSWQRCLARGLSGLAADDAAERLAAAARSLVRQLSGRPDRAAALFCVDALVHLARGTAAFSDVVAEHADGIGAVLAWAGACGDSDSDGATGTGTGTRSGLAAERAAAEAASAYCAAHRAVVESRQLAEIGEVDAAVDVADAARIAFASLGLPLDVAVCRRRLGELELARGRHGRATSLVRAARAEFAAHGLKDESARCELDLAELALAESRLSAAHHHTCTALDTFRAIGAHREAARAALVLHWIGQRRGDTADADAAIELASAELHAAGLHAAAEHCRRQRNSKTS